jgi:AraC family ethanolamine operon transcriptional activator
MAESKRIPATHVWVLHRRCELAPAFSSLRARRQPLHHPNVNTQKASIECLGIHSAMLKIRGMSLHRYLRLRRLWAVRRQLLAGGKTLQIKACALSNGFWHLGEFAALYAAQFGEALSTTLARSQQRLS